MGEGISGKLRGVLRSRRQSAELIGKIFGVDVRGFGDGFVLQLHGEEGCAGDGGSAALTEETGLGDEVVFGFESRGEIKDVAADWIGDVDGGGGVGKFSCVARGLEVIEDGVVQHCLSIPSVDGSGKWKPTGVKRDRKSHGSGGGGD